MHRQLMFRLMGCCCLVVFFLACASGKHHYHTAMQLHNAGNYIEAINYLNQALEIEPNNQEYQRTLIDVKERLVQKHLDEARRELASGTQVTISAFNNARASHAKAREIDREHRSVKAVGQEIEQQYGALLKEIETLYSQSAAYMTAGEWIKAYFNLQQIQSRFPNYEDTYHLMTRCVDQGTEDYYQKAKKLYNQDEFKACAEEVRNALNLNPEHGPSRQLLEQARQNDNMEYFITKAQDSVRLQDWNAVVRAYEKALRYSPDNTDLSSALALARDHSSRWYVTRARQHLNSGLLLPALNDYFNAVQYLHDPNDFQVRSLKADLSSRIIAVARLFKDRGAYGTAWFWYQKLKQMEADHHELFELTLSMEDKISQRVQKSIAVFDFESPSSSPDAGKIFANNLSNYLFNNASGDIKIMERERLKSIMDEMKLGVSGMVVTEQAKRMGDLYGIDIAIMGSVLKYHVEKSVSQSTKTVRYQVGTKIEDNIDFLNWKARNPNPKPKDLESAPPAKVIVPEFVSSSYNVANHKKVGFVELSFRIVDISTGENIQVKTIDRTIVVEDETSAGLEEAGIEFDPLEIPTDTELLNKMTEEVVAELGREVLRPLENLEKRYFEAGESLIRRRNKMQAIEKFVDAIMDEKLKMIQGSPIHAQSIQYIEAILAEYVSEI